MTLYKKFTYFEILQKWAFILNFTDSNLIFNKLIKILSLLSLSFLFFPSFFFFSPTLIVSFTASMPSVTVMRAAQPPLPPSPPPPKPAAICDCN